MIRSAAGIEQVGEQDDDALAVELCGGVTGRRDEVRRAVGGLDRRQVGQQPEHPPGAAHRGPPPGHPTGQGADGDPILAGEPDVPERSGRPLGEQQLGRPSGGHRRRGVDQQGDRDVLLLDEQLDEQAFEPGVDVPVELAQVVAQA